MILAYLEKNQKADYNYLIKCIGVNCTTQHDVCLPLLTFRSQLLSVFLVYNTLVTFKT